MGLLNVLQAASNTAADTVAAPVDGIAWILRKLGVPVEAPVGGSDWMRRQGLTREVAPGMERAAGETLGLLSPMVAAAKAPQIASGLLKMGENAAAPATVSRGMAGSQRGIFGGELAKTADKEALSKAKKMADAGADQRAIWSETGWFKGGDGKWRFEIDDSAASMTGALPEDWVAQAYKRGGIDEVKRLKDYTPPYLQEGTREVGDVFSHRKLTEAYPWATQHRSYQLDAKNPVIGEGSYSPNTGTISISRANEPTARSAMLHELQHAVQDAEGFARGGDPGSMGLLLESLADKKRAEAQKLMSLAMSGDPLAPGKVLKPGARAKALSAEKTARDYASLAGRIEEFGPGIAQDAYKRLAGEAEARAVQARMNLTPAQRRALFPLDSYDVPLDQLIYR